MIRTETESGTSTSLENRRELGNHQSLRGHVTQWLAMPASGTDANWLGHMARH